MAAEDKGIPRDLLEKARCAIIIPGAKKGGFFIGAEYGRGFAICRDENTGWAAPAAVRMEGGSIGAQIGAAETDIFMLVMNDRGMKHLLESKFTLDASAGVAAGPLRNDLDENKELYGKPLTNQEVLSGNVKPPAAAAGLIATLNKYSGTAHKARTK